MPRMTILNLRDCNEFEDIAKFNNYDRKKHLAMSNQVTQMLDNIQITQNKVYFMLMLGYFKCTNKFYTKNFNEKEIKYL